MKRIALALLVLVGCSPCLETNLPMPENFTEKNRAEKLQGEMVSLATWWEQFEDPLLNQLIMKALHKNYDLRLARERICQSRAQFGVEFSRLLPQLDADLSFSREKNSETEGDSPFLGGRFENFYRVGFDALWEIDIFGKNLDRARAARFNVIAQQERARDVNLSVTSEVAINYFLIRNLQDRIHITLHHIRSAEELVETTKVRNEVGIVSELDVFTARALQDTRLADLADLESRLQQTIYAIAVLLGDIPESIQYNFDAPREKRIVSAEIPIGIPSELLCRRGDVREAEYNMLASGATVSAARKEFFPTLSFAGLYKYSTSFFKEWFKAPSCFWRIRPFLELPVFHGGEILSKVHIATSEQRQATLEYEKTVINALQEVETSLVAYFQEKVRIENLINQVENYREAKASANDLYSAGLVDFLFVFEIEKNLYSSEMAASQSEELLRAKLVNIYKALGGGWECSSSL
ncbi:MAG: efflux transporter outer membrane subunit [Chlamydiales bacterium]